MENQETEPQALSDDQIRENLRAHAEALDEGESPEPPVVTKTPESATKSGEGKEPAEGKRAPDAKTEEKPVSSETSTEEGVEAKPGEQKPGEQKPESKYKKAQKDQARFERNWKKLEERQRALTERERQLAELAQRNQPPIAHQPRFKSGDYWNAAENFEKEGLKLLKEDPEAAEEKFSFARAARTSAQQAYQLEYREAAQNAYNQFAKSWTDTAEKVIKDHPEYADENSEAAVQMMELLEAYPILGQNPEGFKQAHEILELRKAATEVSGLREENEKLKKENERLTGLTSISGVRDGSRQSHGKTGLEAFNAMSIDEQRELLRRDAEAADNAA